MHWADVVAERLKESGREQVIATGITPSGHIHVGNMREILTGDLVYRAALDHGVAAKLVYIADDFDPLRRVYPFLPDSYSEHVGKPLSEIPSPDGEGTYAEHFLKPFLEALTRLGINPEVVRGSESYRSGRYAEAVRTVMDNRGEIRSILERISGRKLPLDWVPYNAKCGQCSRIDSTKVIGWDPPHVHYRCDCGHEGKADTRTDDGKLPWRLDWPARWYWLGVTCEPFGKDHAAAGGSYDTSSAIVRSLFNREPPLPVVYEWIQLKGKGAMSSSTGVVITAVDMLRMTPPEVLRFLVARNQPARHIDMDPGLGILNLVDDFDRYEEDFHSEGEAKEKDRSRTYQLSLVDPKEERKKQARVPYRHLVTLVQLTDDLDSLMEKVRRTEGYEHLDEGSRTHIEERAECVRYWLSSFAPDMVKFELNEETPPEALADFDEGMISALTAMGEVFRRTEWTPEAIHNGIYEGSRDKDIKPKTTFKALYKLLLNKERGPRLGYFLSNLEKEDVIRRIDMALSRLGRD